MNIDFEFLNECASASAPKARQGQGRKPAQLRAFSPPSLVERRTTHRTGPPAANFAQPGPVLGSIPGQAERSAPAELGSPLSIREVARLIGCSPWTVRQTLIPRGLPFFRSGASGKLIFYRDQVVRWIEQIQGGMTTK
jgi:excisionase family DNA binding protein